MIQKDGSIVITNPQKGISGSAILGNEAIIGCEIFDEPGVLKIQNTLEADSSQINNPSYVTLAGVPVADVTNYNSQFEQNRVVLTEDGKLFGINNAEFQLASNLTKGWDVCIWNANYTVVSYTQSGGGAIGVIYQDDTDSTTATWNPGEVTGLTSNHAIKLLLGQDGFMYYTNGQYIGRIDSITGTGSSITVTATSNALDLKKGTYAVSMAELGSRLMIGTQRGYSYSQRHNFTGADIYPWDRVSSSFNLPVRVNENGMNAMISHQNQVYFSAGNDGNIYVTDGTNYQKVKRLPFNRSGFYVASSWVYLNAMCISQRGNLLIGLSANYDANSPTTTGIWEIALQQGYPTHLPYFSRDNNLGQTSNVRFGSVRVLDDNNLAIGVQSGSTYELSKTALTLNTSYTAKWRTEMFMVGTRKSRKSYSNLEFLLTRPLLANQGIKISYRKNLQDDFTVIGTWDYSTLGSVISHETKALIADAEMVQFEIALTYSSAIFGKNLNLIRIILN